LELPEEHDERFRLGVLVPAAPAPAPAPAAFGVMTIFVAAVVAVVVVPVPPCSLCPARGDFLTDSRTFHAGIATFTGEANAAAAAAADLCDGVCDDEDEEVSSSSFDVVVDDDDDVSSVLDDLVEPSRSTTTLLPFRTAAGKAADFLLVLLGVAVPLILNVQRDFVCVRALLLSLPE